MAVRATEEAVRAIAQLSKNPLWQQVDELFARELAETYQHLSSTADEAKLRQLQGRAQLLREIQDLVRDAPDKSKKFTARAGTS